MALSTHLSNHKLHLLGMLYAIPAWGIACIELGANTRLWFSDLSKQGYLQAWGDEMPYLASDGSVLSWNSRALLMLLNYLPILLSAFSLVFTGLFFRHLVEGEHWSQRNARALAHIGLLSLLILLLQPFINTLQGLVLSPDLPDGECVLSVSIGLTSEVAYEFLEAVFLCSFGPTVSEVRKLDEEVRAFT